MTGRSLIIFFFAVAISGARSLAAPPATQTSISEPSFNEAKGVWQCKVTSPYQKGENPLEVLLPDQFDKAKKYRVLYVLPVEEGMGKSFGDGLQEVRKADAHNKHQLICVQMAFDFRPWYCNHATKPEIRHEDYMLRVVFPMIDERYPTVDGPEGKLLFGFSKSGWGAYTLLLRHPDIVGYAASWDAPLTMKEDLFNMGIDWASLAYGTRENFSHYIPSKLIEEKADLLKDHRRLVLLGSVNFGNGPYNLYKDHPHAQTLHARMDELGVKHIYNNDLNTKAHNWTSGWVPGGIEALMQAVNQPKPATQPTN